MITRDTIGKKLNKIVDDSGMNPTQVADKANKSQSTLSKWLRNKSNINLIDYIHICEACGIPNGVFDEREIIKDLPPEVSEQAEDLINTLLEVYQLSGEPEENPFDGFLEHAKYLRNLIKNSIGIIKNTDSKKPIDFVAEEQKEYEVKEKPFQFKKEDTLSVLTLIEDMMVSIKKYDRACAGNAGYIDDKAAKFLPYYVEGYKGRPDIALLEISGDSMTGLVENGDVLVVKNFDKPITIDGENHIPLNEFRKHIKHGDLCVINFNCNGQEVKQLFYSGRDDNWGLSIKATNPVWGERTLHKGQSLVIYGTILGKVKEKN